ncbi:DUF2855 family protein [Agarilytica rhodophyticola]|uniref:DUF2855 family protein n=1 Tax=Agarilytica rhodophyticola TaxID=1737490 RepID=UPI000B346D50|nr:DUF2855 family protein [Agarilytica rhodophyticola]
MTEQLIKATEIWVEKTNVANSKIVEQELAVENLSEGEVLLKIDSFGFSANNITYAMFGDKMGYWGFFPANEQWGIVPVWGFATVIASTHPALKVGERMYGYLPMASHWIVQVGKESATGFIDVHPKRKSISPVYDNYLYCAADPGYREDREPWQLNYRPLFMTSFVLDDFVREGLCEAQQNSSDVRQVILTSASSKTAYGAAHLLLKHKAESDLGYQVIGLTSPANKEFTSSLGCYDKVFAYDEVDALSFEQNSWVLDFAGNKSLLLQLQVLLGDKLGKLLLIGSTDVEAQQDKPDGNLNSEFFFAPSQVKKRMHEWGKEGFSVKYAQAWQGFATQLGDNLKVASYSGAEAIQKVYQFGLQGSLSNAELNVLKFD